MWYFYPRPNHPLLFLFLFDCPYDIISFMSFDNFNEFIKLVKHYATLKKGAFIKNHKELLEIFNITKSKHEKHPYKNKKV